MFKKLLVTFMLSLSSECSGSMKKSYNSLKILTRLCKDKSTLTRYLITCGWYPVTSGIRALVGYAIGSVIVDNLPRLHNRPTIKRILSHGIMWCSIITGTVVAAHMDKYIDTEYAEMYKDMLTRLKLGFLL